MFCLPFVKVLNVPALSKKQNKKNMNAQRLDGKGLLQVPSSTVKEPKRQRNTNNKEMLSNCEMKTLVLEKWHTIPESWSTGLYLSARGLLVTLTFIQNQKLNT